MVTPDAAMDVVPGATGAPGPGASEKLGWRVARRLAESVIRRGWPVGARLGTEMELLEALGVSREPFREGIRLLELQGIVRMARGPGGGLFVTAPALEVVSSLVHGYLELSEITFREVIAARQVIEGHAVKLAVRRLTPAGAGVLERALQAAAVAMYDRSRHRTAYFDVLRALQGIGADPCLSMFDQALHRITMDFGLHERLPGELWSEYSARGYRALEQLVGAVLARDEAGGRGAVEALLSRMDDYVHRAEGAEDGLWTTRSYITGAYLSAGKLSPGAEKSGLRLAYRITAEVRRRSLPAGCSIGPETELVSRYGVSRAVFREAVRMLEFFGVVEVRRGKDGGLVVAEMDPEGTIGSALLYLDYAGIDAAQAGELLELLQVARCRCATSGAAGNRALALFEGVLTRLVAATLN
jgi:DNA-binding FadR family transcriptional regulator